MRTRMSIASIVLAAVGGLVPVAATAPAQAATYHTWDRLAHCESGGRWHLATGNGYYGGLQFSRSTWRAYGGRHFAARADRARRVQQIKVAKRVKRSQGWRAWPVCSHRIGLR
ncbi:MAG: transglycosylase family protein [Nocardioidaceae bacterium]